MNFEFPILLEKDFLAGGAKGPDALNAMHHYDTREISGPSVRYLWVSGTKFVRFTRSYEF